jgi:hypothetical protein
VVEGQKHKCDVYMNCCPSILNEHGEKDDQSGERMADVVLNYQYCTYIRIIMLNPLHADVPAVVIAIMGMLYVFFLLCSNISLFSDC